MSILIISGIEGVRNCADAFQKQLGTTVEVAASRREALAVLRHKDFAAVVVDETLAECDPAAADAIWERSGLAIPLQINFAVSGAARIIREIRAALQRREREHTVALRAASASVEMELKETVAGLLLHSQLALSQGGVPAVVAEKLRLVVDLAGTLREQLSVSPRSVRTAGPR
jgi:CheY-like chemotaxis protein